MPLFSVENYQLPAGDLDFYGSLVISSGLK